MPGGGAGASSGVVGVSHAEGGMANETVMVDLGPGNRGIVLRLPPLEATFPNYDLSLQAVVQNAVAAAGVAAPAPTVIVQDPQWLGTPFLVMPKVSGFIPGPAPVFDPIITSASEVMQRNYQDGLLETLAGIHALDPRSLGLAGRLVGPTLRDGLEYWRTYIEWAGEGHPLAALTEAIDWCIAHQPVTDTDDSVLLWGDPRLGNLVFDAAGSVHAVLDWDLAAMGPPEADLGWYFGLDFMMEQLFSERVRGFRGRREAIEHYEGRSGRVVRHLDFHEVFALARALAINDRHQRITIAGRPTQKRANAEALPKGEPNGRDTRRQVGDSEVTAGRAEGRVGLGPGDAGPLDSLRCNKTR